MRAAGSNSCRGAPRAPRQADPRKPRARAVSEAALGRQLLPCGHPRHETPGAAAAGPASRQHPHPCASRSRPRRARLPNWPGCGAGARPGLPVRRPRAVFSGTCRRGRVVARAVCPPRGVPQTGLFARGGRGCWRALGPRRGARWAGRDGSEGVCVLGAGAREPDRASQAGAALRVSGVRSERPRGNGGDSGSSGGAEVGGGRCLWVLATCWTRVQGQPRQRCSLRGPRTSSPGLASADSGGQAVPRPLPQPRSGTCAGPPSRAELRRGQGGARAVRLERWRRRLISHLMGEASPCFLQAPVGLSPTGLCRGRSHSSTTRATKPSATKPSATEPSATKPSVCRRGCGWPLCVCAPHKLSV